MIAISGSVVASWPSSRSFAEPPTMPTCRLPPCFAAAVGLELELELLVLLPQAASKEATLTPAPATRAPLSTSRRV